MSDIFNIRQKLYLKIRIFFNNKVKNKNRLYLRFYIYKLSKKVIELYGEEKGKQVINISKNNDYDMNYKKFLIKKCNDD